MKINCLKLSDWCLEMLLTHSKAAEDVEGLHPGAHRLGDPEVFNVGHVIHWGAEKSKAEKTLEHKGHEQYEPAVWGLFGSLWTSHALWLLVTATSHAETRSRTKTWSLWKYDIQRIHFLVVTFVCWSVKEACSFFSYFLWACWVPLKQALHQYLCTSAEQIMAGQPIWCAGMKYRMLSGGCVWEEGLKEALVSVCR